MKGSVFMKNATISGLYTKELFRNLKTMYTCFILKNDDTSIICAGEVQKLPFNTPITLTGTFKTDNKGRKTFTITDYEIKDNKSCESVSLLMSLKIEGLTIDRACELSDYFNYSITDIIKSCTKYKNFKDRCPKEFGDVAKDIYVKIKHILNEFELTKEVLCVGGNISNVTALIKLYGKNAIDALKRNPYRSGFYAGFSFYTCEQLAVKYNINAFSDRRAEGILLYGMNNSVKRGDSYVTVEELHKFSDKFQKNKNFFTPFESVLAKAVLNDNFVIHENKIYLKSMYATEENVAANIKRLTKSAKQLERIDKELVNEIEKRSGITFSASQKQAFNALASEGIKVITGGPGSGKTTLVNSIIKYVKTKYPGMGITLCAPTGRAAQNMAAKTNHVAETIHKTLGLRPYSEKEMRVTKKLSSYVYIVDESSMIDLELMDIFIGSVPNHAIVLFVGDKDQLASVGAGNVFNDMLYGGIEKYVLEGTHRQTNGSAIINNALKINRGDISLDLNKSDFDVIYADDEETAANLCVMYTGKEEAQILTPLNEKSLVGARALSKRIQSTKKFICPGKKTYGDITYHIGDKVIMLRNNYEGGYFNGDTGIISNIYDDYISVILDDVYDPITGGKKEIEVNNTNLCDMTLSYAISIHKSQGGEYDEAVVILTKSAQGMVNRNLLYTAVTRAKKKVTIITQDNLLEKAIQTELQLRNSALGEKIRCIMSE